MAERRERVGVGRAGGALADGEDANDRVELVGDRHELARKAPRQFVAGEPRPVVVNDRLGYHGRLARRVGVAEAHDALEGGELDDRMRYEVGLGEVRRAGRVGGLVGRRVDRSGKRSCERLDPRHLGAERPELLVKNDAVELVDVALERAREVLVHEERSVGQTRADHPLVAGDDRVGARGVAVVDHEEARKQAAVGVLHREVPLVALHRLFHDLARHGEERVVEPAHARPLGTPRGSRPRQTSSRAPRRAHRAPRRRDRALRG